MELRSSDMMLSFVTTLVLVFLIASAGVIEARSFKSCRWAVDVPSLRRGLGVVAPAPGSGLVYAGTTGNGVC